MIDPALRALSSRLQELERRDLDARRGEEPITSHDWSALQEEQRGVKLQLDEAWPFRGDVWHSVGPERMVSFFETDPRFNGAFHQQDAYWSALADHEIPGSLHDRLRAVIIRLLDRGFSTALELAARTAAKLWNSDLAAAVEARRAAAEDPALGAAMTRLLANVDRCRAGVETPSAREPQPGETTIAAVSELEAAVAAARQSSPDLRGLNPPVPPQEIERLREAVAPFPLPPSLEAFLSATTGAYWGSWPGGRIGPSFDVAEMIEQYGMATEMGLPPVILPIGYRSHEWLAIELVDDREAAVLECPFDGGVEVIAPSLRSFLDATTACVRAGYFTQWLEQGVWSDDPIRTEFDRIWDEVTTDAGWDHAPWSPHSHLSEEHYPEVWGRSTGS